MTSREEYFNMAIKGFVIQDSGREDLYDEYFQLMAGYLYHTLGIHFLYRYRSDVKWARDKTMFESDKIWLQPMSGQNDELEFSFDFDIACCDPLAPFLALCPSLYSSWKVINKFQQQFEDYKNKCLIACFSDSYDNNCLWSGYANSHQGYCISYSVLDILPQFQCVLLPVIYQDKIPTLSDALACTENDKNLLPYYVVFKRIATKLMRWADEREWRVIRTLISNEVKGMEIQFSEPRAVYLGYKAEEPLESDIKAICQKKHIPVFKMEKNDTTNRLNPIQIQE